MILSMPLVSEHIRMMRRACVRQPEEIFQLLANERPMSAAGKVNQITQ